LFYRDDEFPGLPRTETPTLYRRMAERRAEGRPFLNPPVQITSIKKI
jgi:hypothetical protein